MAGLRSRRLVKLGSSLFVSLPAEWAKANGLRPGSEVYVEEGPSGELFIRPAGLRRSAASVGGPSAPRRFLAAYLDGHDEIQVDLRRTSAEDARRIREMAQSLVGVEKVFEDSEKAVYACFVGEGHDPASISSRIVDTLAGMATDAARALDDADPESLRAAASRDSVVDRLYFLLIRILRSSASLPRVKLMDFRALAKVLERMGDEVSWLAARAPEGWDGISLGPSASEISRALRRAHELFLGGGVEEAEMLGSSMWATSCGLYRVASSTTGFRSQAYYSYSVLAGLVKDIADLVS